VTDPREETLPDVGLVNMQDAETGSEILVNTRNKKFRSLYEARARKRALRRDELFARTRVDAIHVRTDEPYIDEIHRFFKMRERRHA
jgi:uncharacterized protein (DUF58 family)